jgi:hypothetical protein
MSVFTGELNYSQDLTQIFVSNHLQMVDTNVVFLNCIVTCFNRWISHIEDMHVQDNEEHIGTQDLGLHGLQTWIARRNVPDPTLFDNPDLSADLLAL